MSSSRRNSLTKAELCPTCGRRSLRHVIEDVDITLGRRSHLVRAVPHEYCSHCQERIFGFEASHMFDSLVPSTARRRAA
jgi:YgiT-type zinc finger domain-containing protein